MIPPPSQQDPVSPGMERLYDRLGDRARAERERAAREVRALPPDQLTALIAVPGRRSGRWYRPWWAAVFAWIAFLVGVMLWIVQQHPELLLSHSWVIGVCFFAMLLPTLYACVSSRSERNLIHALASALRPEVVGCASRYAGSPYVRNAITPLLQQLRPADAEDWTAEQRARLTWPLYQLTVAPGMRNTVLLWNGTHAYAHALLKALEQVGNGSERVRVEMLAKIWAFTPTDRALKRAAEECLPFLEPRARELEKSQTLLRASDAHGYAPDSLLRAAGVSSASSAEQLLRPNASE